MAVIVTVLVGAFCTIAALLSMFVFGVTGSTILQIYAAFCLAMAVLAIASAVFLRLQNPRSGNAFKYHDVSAGQTQG